MRNQEKGQALLNSGDVGMRHIMHTNVEYLSCCRVQALGYFQLSDMRYDDRNVVTEKSITTVL